ncbi:MerR family transcriptional regulator [Neobacillus sp. 3P2-tot-E-2]|uniref:MerR family transcriptional regulator n=1 Tax=Neobacillus sp. 3P2-tot-E-2 TaxID=3132212 RepID=UPI0039A3668C
MAAQEGKYNIKAAALMLGIQPGTLRAWERRYQMVAPVRNEAGHRLYTDEHIKILKWLIKKVNQGFTISQAVSLMGHNQSQMDPETLNLKQDNPLISLSDSLYEALIHFEHDRINEIINKLFSIFTMEKVIIEIFSQMQKKIEDSFSAGKIVSAQRYFSLSLIKARVETIIHSFPINVHQNKALCINWSTNGDSIELLMFTFYLRKRGIQVINIGKFSSEDESDQILDMIHPDLVIISCEVQEELKDALLVVNHLTKKHRDLTIGLGGKAVNAMKKSNKDQYSSFIFGQTINEWEMWLLERMVF